jgi:large conductance mechanosensitive channel
MVSMKRLLSEFRQFVMQGNVIDLAVAVVIGAAFKAIIDSLVGDVIQPIVGAVFGKPDFRAVTFKVGDGVVRYGSFVTQVLNFLIVAAALFVVIRAFEELHRRRARGDVSEEAAEVSAEVQLLTEIRDALVATR